LRKNQRERERETTQREPFKRLRLGRDQQIRVLASLRHPHIVPLLAVYETPTHLLLVMERAHGGELFDRISEKTVYSEKDARDLIRTLLDVLVHLEAKHIAHRDLKV